MSNPTGREGGGGQGGQEDGIQIDFLRPGRVVEVVPTHCGRKRAHFRLAFELCLQMSQFELIMLPLGRVY